LLISASGATGIDRSYVKDYTANRAYLEAFPLNEVALAVVFAISYFRGKEQI
jgi:hypothetical protein